jgi:hypothetical protein
MSEDLDSKEHRKLLNLVRQICKEEIAEVLDRHLEDYVHEEKPASEEVLDHE